MALFELFANKSKFLALFPAKMRQWFFFVSLHLIQPRLDYYKILEIQGASRPSF